eukprot:932338-Rhodomonas_salina.1
MRRGRRRGEGGVQGRGQEAARYRDGEGGGKKGVQRGGERERGQPQRGGRGRGRGTTKKSSWTR